MDSKEIDMHFEEEYVCIIDTFKPEDFQEQLLQHTMRHKLYRANKPWQGHCLKKKFCEILAEVRSKWIFFLSMNISQLASGYQECDAYEALIVKIYQATHMSPSAYCLLLLSSIVSKVVELNCSITA